MTDLQFRETTVRADMPYKAWNVRDPDDIVLGRVCWITRYGQYAFVSDRPAPLSASWIAAILHFICKAMAEHIA